MRIFESEPDRAVLGKVTKAFMVSVMLYNDGLLHERVSAQVSLDLR
jgi:hypothetical protein